MFIVIKILGVSFDEYFIENQSKVVTYRNVFIFLCLFLLKTYDPQTYTKCISHLLK